MGKRNYVFKDHEKQKLDQSDYDYLVDDSREYYDSLEHKSTQNRLLEAIKQQNKLLEKTYSKILDFLDPQLVTITENRDFVTPYYSDKPEPYDKRNLDKKTLAYYYFGDDW